MNVELFKFNLIYCYKQNSESEILNSELSILRLYNHTLISTSTPLGNSNFIKASMVFDEEL
jgi:hypothetical protein